LPDKEMVSTITPRLILHYLGKKQFEMTDHLGNVNSTISDRKIPVESTITPGTISYKIADILSTSGFYPFGMMIKSREFVGFDSYKYSLNGQEKDDEIYGDGNATTAMYWEYDTRLGRRWNTDPKPTVEVSAYACFYNNPIAVTDPNGDEPNKEGQKTLPGVKLPEDSPLISRKAIIPKYKISLGVSLSTPGLKKQGTWDHHPILGISTKKLYGTNVRYPFGGPWGKHDNDASEDNTFVDFLIRFKETNLQFGGTYYKEKTEKNAAGYGTEAPSYIMGTAAANWYLFKNSDEFVVSASVSSGALFGISRYKDVPYGKNYYHPMGVASAFIGKITWNVTDFITVWVAATVTGVASKNEGQPIEVYPTATIKGGISVEFERLGRKQQ